MLNYKMPMRKTVSRRKASASKTKKYVGRKKVAKRVNRRKSKGTRTIIRAVPGGLTESTWYGGSKRMTKRVYDMKKLGAPNAQVQNFSTVLNIPQNQQIWRSFGLSLRSQLGNIMTYLPGGPVTSTSGFNRAIMETSHSELTFTNPGNSAIELDIYDVVFKRDVPTQLTIQVEGGNVTCPGAVEDLITTGVNYGNNNGANDEHNAQYYGASPYDSQLFRDYCKVKKVSHVLLPSGASHRHKVTNSICKLIDQSVAGSESLLYIKGFSSTTLVCAKGVAGINMNPSEIPLEGLAFTTITGGNLGVVTSTRIKYTYVADATNSLQYTNFLTIDNPLYVRNIGSGNLEYVFPSTIAGIFP